jgi:hypothetical protein
MTALLYPQTKIPKYGYKSWQEENVLRNDAQSAKFQEKDLWGRTLFRASMTYDLRTDDTLIVYAFWKQTRVLAQAGSIFTFDFFDFTDDIYLPVLLGNASGAVNQVLDIPGNKTRLYAWYDNGVLGSNANIQILTGTGVNGRDQVKILTAPTAGHPITFSYTGHGCFTCAFVKRPDKVGNAYLRLGLQADVVEVP